jgi:hypothetical protein|tara:strand:+ start:135 stop:1043 length:909 start_codon:yes stop_codon:yes gene_type:complete
MFADQLIKALASKNPLLEITSFSRTEEGAPKEESTLLELLTSSVHGRRCQFFDFDYISYSGVNNEYAAALPAWCEGFLQLPAPLCFFEFSSSLSQQEKKALFPASPPVHDTVHIGLLLAESYYTDHEAFGVGINAFWSGKDPNGAPWMGESGRAEILYGGQNGDSSGIIVPVTKMSSRLFAQPEVGRDAVLKLATPLLVMLGRLNADGVEKSLVLPPEKLNRRRRQRNQPELVVHTTVKISPYRAPLGHSGPREGGDFTPPRYHFRRGHVRRFQNGEKTWVRPCFVGDPENGCVQHDYVVNA